MMLERCQEVLRDQAELEALCLSEYPEAKETYEQEVRRREQTQQIQSKF
jgi:hypothetical protein